MSAVFAFLLTIVITVNSIKSTHNQQRDYKCRLRNETLRVDCRLVFEESNDEWDTINDNGCFQEFNSNLNDVLEYCPLQCQDAEKARIIQKIPSDNSQCQELVNFNVERRKNDWFLWRLGNCRKTEVRFRIRCMSPKSSNTKKYYKQIKQKKLYIIEEENKKKEENMSKNGEPTISFIPLSANNEGDLPTKVEALIKTMFPSYRP